MQRQELAGLGVSIPTHRGEAAMDGAPEHLWRRGKRRLEEEFHAELDLA